MLQSLVRSYSAFGVVAILELPWSYLLRSQASLLSCNPLT